MNAQVLFPLLLLALGVVWIVLGGIHGAWLEIAIGVAITAFAVLGYRKGRTPR